MRVHLKFILFFTLILTGCSNNNNENSNPLSNTGLIGDWEISGRGINNVSSLEAVCCETIKFIDDANTHDFRGTYIFNDSSGVVTNGIFTVDSDNGAIAYTTENDNTYILEYSLNSNVLEVWFFDGGNRNWTTYIKTSNI